MKTSYFKRCLLPALVLLCINAHAQHFTETLKTLNAEYRQEKLYLQFDRSLYNAGETIWFKAYLFAGNFPSLVSKTIYTELTDAEGKVLQRVVSPVIMSGAAGALNIPADITGTVFVRSYTKWMLNFDSSFLYNKAIAIIPAQKPVVQIRGASLSKSNPVITTSSIVLQFFPEGGDLVEGVESQVAFKATDRYGIPVVIAGEVMNSKGKLVTTFESIHDGMGVFSLQPETGESYKAVWKDQQGQTHESILPSAKQNGIVLEAGQTPDQIVFTVKRQSGTAIYPYVYVVAQMQQQLLYKAKVNISEKTSFTAVIPSNNLPAGIVQLTVFTPKEQPTAERIVFINQPEHSFTTTVKMQVKDFGKRKMNVIQIEVPDTISCNLSVAVTDAALDSAQQDNTIYSHLLLTSDIKGYVYHPAYYFSSNADSVAAHLDLVMMTNGWRRFKWEEVLAGHLPVLKYLPENYISIEGQVQGFGKTSLVQKEINGVLELKNRGKEFLSFPVQPDGKFNFQGMVFYDTAKLYYQFNKDKNKTLTAKADFEISTSTLKEPLHLKPRVFPLADFFQQDTTALIKLNEIYQQYLAALEMHKVKMLKAVVVTSKVKTKQQKMDEEYTTGFFSDDPSRHSRIILPDDDPSFLASPDLLSYLQNRIAGLQIFMLAGEASITWRGFQTSLFVNEIPQTSLSFDPPVKIIEDASYILSLPMSEIAMVKIFDPPFFGSGSSGTGGQGGAISVYLKKGNERNQMQQGLYFAVIPGYSPLKEFYSPNYAVPENNDIPDYRSTLYWNPFVFTSKNKRQVSLTFYNNDITKKIRIIIEGCNDDGKLTRVEKLVE